MEVRGGGGGLKWSAIVLDTAEASNLAAIIIFLKQSSLAKLHKNLFSPRSPTFSVNMFQARTHENVRFQLMFSEIGRKPANRMEAHNRQFSSIFVS